MLPLAYAYPQGMRATRDLLRRRMLLSRTRAEAIAHVQNTVTQYNLPPLGKKLSFAANREGIAEKFPEESVRRMVTSDLDRTRLRRVPRALRFDWRRAAGGKHTSDFIRRRKTSCPQAECALTGDPDPSGSARRFESAGIWGTEEFLGRGRFTPTRRISEEVLPQSPPLVRAYGRPSRGD